MVNASLLDLLACPRDVEPLRFVDGVLVCPHGHRYAVVDDIPILLRDDVHQTHWVADEALREALVATRAHESPTAQGDVVDSFVQEAVGATGGFMYRSRVHRLKEYPIPDLPLPEGGHRLLLDVGCNWGRWTIAAFRRGYRVVGIDPSLNAVRAARRVARQLDVDAQFVVGDARYLPIRTERFDVVFSYSVLQHLGKSDAVQALRDIKRVLRQDGIALIQMPNVYGIRCLYHQLRRRFRPARDFQVRYWRPAELQRTFATAIGPAHLSVDGFFSLNAQPAEAHLLPRRFQFVVWTSDVLRRASRHLPSLVNVADSIWIRARKT